MKRELTEDDLQLLVDTIGRYGYGDLMAAFREWQLLSGCNLALTTVKAAVQNWSGKTLACFCAAANGQLERSKLRKAGLERIALLERGRVGGRVAGSLAPDRPAVSAKPLTPSPSRIEALLTELLAAMKTPQAGAVEQVPVQAAEPTQEAAPADNAAEPNVAPATREADDDSLAKLLKIVRTQETLRLEELCDRLDMSPARVKELVEEARGQGFDVQLEDEWVGRSPPSDQTAETTVAIPAPIAGTHTIALVGDIHFGSKQHLRGPFEDFCAKAYERGVRRFLCAGDMLDGAYKFSFNEQNVRGFEDQADYAIEHLPRFDGATWTLIAGNHDETFDASGINVCRAINEAFRGAGRDDVEFIGARGAYVRLIAPGQRRGAILELWHPKGGASYAISYRLQNKIRDYGVGQKPDIVAMGHTHQSMYFTQRGVHAFATGCWQGGKSAFGRSIGGSPAIGSWIVEYSQTEQETIRSVTPTWIGYYESEEPRPIDMA